MAALANLGRAVERRPAAVVAGLAAVGALLRFASLDGQSFWLDESATVDVLSGSWADMFDELSTSEGTPPLYYALAKAWTSLFGSGEAGLRSLSALAGTLTVPVAYLLGEAAASRRAGLLAAALVAVHPYLIWYSQEARAYALFALLAACSLLFLVRVLERHDRRSLVAWTAFSALTMATHYFGGFLVAAEALWLVARGPRRAALVASAVLAVVAAALVPLVLEQRSHGGNQAWIVERSLGRRLDGLARGFLAGETTRYLRGAVPLAALLASVGALLLLARGRLAECPGLVALAGAALAGAAVPVVLALLGADYVVARNFIFLLVAGLVVLGAGLAAPARAGRLGMAAALALLALYAVLDVKAVRDESLQRDDWAALVGSLGEPAGGRALAVYPPDQVRPLELYARGEQAFPAAGAQPAEIDLIGVGLGPGAEPPAPPPGFEPAGVRRLQHFTVVSFRAPAPRTVSPAELAALPLGGNAPALLLQRGPGVSGP
jgi:mannosyltransferase